MAQRAEEKRKRREARLEAERREREAAARRRRLGLAGGAAVVLAVVAVVVVLLVGGGSDSGGGASAAGGDLPGAQTGPPPWNEGTDGLEDRLSAIGLPALTAEGTVVHIHQHLDVIVNGKPVDVPANIGIDAAQQFLSTLHTHDDTGIIHVESPSQGTFTLGQFFDVWGVPLTARRVGGLRAGGGKELRAWVNGKPVSGDPAKIRLAEHQEIVLAYGTAAQMPKHPPSSFDFPQGL